MNNAIWRINSETLVIYVEDMDVIRKIRRSYPDFIEFAQYYREGKLLARQYYVNSKRKRPAMRLLGLRQMTAS